MTDKREQTQADKIAIVIVLILIAVAIIAGVIWLATNDRSNECPKYQQICSL